MEERSRATRHRTLKGGKIVFNNGFSTINCTMRNFSETGAKLVVTSVVGIPDNFELTMDDGRHFSCAIVWRTATELGVAFSS
ncbi:PilZ domain-containing protein [Devosia sp. 63-57]|uniref:PilZ domain-containing protein n=1 Tax=Devosia sp. 63-57 TaxID=1895751 RepID=UPI00086CA8B5|nr:PilZ domain-containing protein [Devosia sp. 63-57]ODT47559.1 MAG: hypothetical protein ABS74_14975 [Pelagibacterium sp. SCN 63-126]ODU86369.1 MAG: hypothetical protein ABT14_08885 [Pelagibacterium sp. SCN 63-17]OJX42734.1 MAG: hypothetical protein BGO80_14890 [Devosia sp. 63-57]